MNREGEVFEELKELLRARFPDIACVRCGENSFVMNVQRQGGPIDDIMSAMPLDATKAAGVSQLDLVCQSCGFMEKHDVRFLAKSLRPTAKA